MATLKLPREQVEAMLRERLRAGEDLVTKAELAAETARYRDWLHLFEIWRRQTITDLWLLKSPFLLRALMLQPTAETSGR